VRTLSRTSTAFAVVLSVLLPAQSAHGHHSIESDQSIDRVTQLIDRGGATNVSEVPCEQWCQEAWTKEQSYSKQSRLPGATTRARQATRVLPNWTDVDRSIWLRMLSRAAVGEIVYEGIWVISGSRSLSKARR
jgi:hypothetical protein